jgi:hypothetical protein
MANEYATDTELMDRLGMSINDARRAIVLEVLEAASRWIDRQTGRRFYAVSETRYFRAIWDRAYTYGPYDSFYMGWGSVAPDQRVFIDDVLSVSALTTDNDGDGVYETTWVAGTDYWLGPRNAPAEGRPYSELHRQPVTGRYDFPIYADGISVVGSFGYCTLANRPSPIRELCLQVAMQMASPQMLASSAAGTSNALAIPGVQSYSIGQELQVTMLKPADALVTLADLPVGATNIINLYRKPSLVV